MMGELTRSPIAAQDPGLLGALGDAALPVEALSVSNGRFFRFEQNGVLVGYGGFEPYGGDALLRSVVVTPPMRGRGTGRAIAEALAAEMQASGIGHAFLLTTTAEAFFRHLGFAEIA